MDMYREQFHSIQDNMRKAFIECCAKDRFKMKFIISTSTLIDMNTWFEQEEHERIQNNRAEYVEYINNMFESRQPESLVSFVLNKITGNPTQDELRVKMIKDSYISNPTFKSLDVFTMFMGRPVEPDEFVPYGEFKVVING